MKGGPWGRLFCFETRPTFMHKRGISFAIVRRDEARLNLDYEHTVTTRPSQPV